MDTASDTDASIHTPDPHRDVDALAYTLTRVRTRSLTHTHTHTHPHTHAHSLTYAHTHTHTHTHTPSHTYSYTYSYTRVRAHTKTFGERGGGGGVLFYNSDLWGRDTNKWINTDTVEERGENARPEWGWGGGSGEGGREWRQRRKGLPHLLKTYLREMCLQSVPGICGLLDALVEWHIDGVPLVPHFIGARVQHTLDFVAHLLGRSTLALGALHIVVAEASPGLRHGNPIESESCTYNIHSCVHLILFDFNENLSLSLSLSLIENVTHS